MKANTALIADDHSLYRRGLGLLLEDSLGFSKVIEVGGLDEALDRLAQTPSISLALFDLSMPGMAGPETLAVVRETYPDLRVAVISGTEEREKVIQSVSIGLGGYIPKSLPDDEIVAALKTILEGRIYVPRFMTVAPLAKNTTRPVLAPAAPEINPTQLDNLTPRQKDVLAGIVRGLSNKEIARELDIAEGTVKIHLAALFSQFGARNRTELATRAQAMQ